MTRRDQSGQATIFIVGLAVVLLLAVALVVDASAAFLRRQGLDSLADGAALAGADAGASGEDVYVNGIDQERLELFASTARVGVADYLHRAGAFERYPGLAYDVRVDTTARSVTVVVRSPLDLPFTLPGAPGRATIGATGSAIVAPER